ncbi:MAG: hypothetical protein KJN63_01345, partial [Acidimicrobiia bacterium]|nr:hypothetical protein [Acidimicrobiia bacterium]
FKLWQPDLLAAIWTVIDIDHRNHVFAWKRRLGLSTLTATHRIKRAKKGCRNELELTVSGLGSSLVERAMRGRALRSLEEENRGIKAAAESQT